MKARKVKGLDPAGSLDRNAARIVLTRLDELRSFVPAALAPGAERAQHDMRIAAKRLRYVLEATGFCLGKPARAARRSARSLQGVLGEIHDCDVMLPRVEAEIDALRESDARMVILRAGDAEDLDPSLVEGTADPAAYADLELLAVHLRARRALLFERFRRHWQGEVSMGTWQGLENAARAKLEAPDTKRGAKSPQHADRKRDLSASAT